MTEFTCYRSYQEELAGFDFFPKLLYDGEFVVVKMIEAKGIPRSVCMRRASLCLPSTLEFPKREKEECCQL